MMRYLGQDTRRQEVMGFTQHNIQLFIIRAENLFLAALPSAFLQGLAVPQSLKGGNAIMSKGGVG
ncbi:MAG: hypothetical protein WCE81_08530 [Halobacteriota archaeon]